MTYCHSSREIAERISSAKGTIRMLGRFPHLENSKIVSEWRFDAESRLSAAELELHYKNYINGAAA